MSLLIVLKVNLPMLSFPSKKTVKQVQSAKSESPLLYSPINPINYSAQNRLAALRLRQLHIRISARCVTGIGVAA